MVAYKLELPKESNIHDTFHVSLLKRHHGPILIKLDESLPQTIDYNKKSTKVPQSVLEIRTIKRINAPIVQWLIQWEQWPMEEVTWEDAKKIMIRFPNYDPWGQG